ncbi:MAG: RDD family protein [Thermoguttaceae bacterium]|nr:RDD family protein [Thermoguttaceae bacterium]MBQ2038949.1 RDD family protein [Thermoguttaceae bacterium]MBQ2557232.1 RDD family protein [Thermoguttaceae bacterium]MBQ3822094.1 RDD family protein [Thermoguttaceae bacterium]MBQ4080062.1 RDD family protein [Thermoguttaceae bacterium]
MKDDVRTQTHSEPLGRPLTLEEPLDTTYVVVAPENVEFKYAVAGPFARSIAFGLDLFFDGLYVFASTLFASFFFYHFLARFDFLSESLRDQLFFVFAIMNFMFVFWFLNAFLEAFWNGKTLGKACLGLRVLTVSGRPIGFGQALLRNVLRFADATLGPFLAPIMAANDRMARLGDLAAGTVVVILKREKIDANVFVFNEPIVLNIASKIPNDFEFTPSLRKALALYVARRDTVSLARRFEIIAPIANALSAKAGFRYRVEPDAFLCALYQRSLGDERQIR